MKYFKSEIYSIFQKCCNNLKYIYFIYNIVFKINSFVRIAVYYICWVELPFQVALSSSSPFLSFKPRIFDRWLSMFLLLRLRTKNNIKIKTFSIKSVSSPLNINIIPRYRFSLAFTILSPLTITTTTTTSTRCRLIPSIGRIVVIDSKKASYNSPYDCDGQKQERGEIACIGDQRRRSGTGCRRGRLTRSSRSRGGRWRRRWWCGGQQLTQLLYGLIAWAHLFLISLE